MSSRSSSKMDEQSRKIALSLSKLKVHPTQSEVRFKIGGEEESVKSSVRKKSSATKVTSLTQSIPPQTLREFKDDVDHSCHPSYTNFKLP